MKRAIAISVLVLIGALAAAFVWAGLTSSGARWAAGQLEKILPIQIEGLEGSLLTAVGLESLVYKSEAITIEVDQLSLALNWRCFVRSRVCVERLHARALRVTQATAESTEKEAFDLAALFERLPEAQIDDLHIKTAEWRRGERHEVLKDVRLQTELVGGVLTTEQLDFCHQLGCLEAVASFGADGLWDLEVDVDLDAASASTDSVRVPNQVHLSAVGNLKELDAVLESADVPALRVATSASIEENGWSMQSQGEGLAQLFPQLDELPWVRVSGPLTIGVEPAASGLKIDVLQQLTGYRKNPVELTITLLEDAGRWSLPAAELKDGEESLLHMSGTLGALDGLEPDLRVLAQNLSGPAGSEFEALSFNASMKVHLNGKTPLESWNAELEEFVLDDGEQRLELSGELRASQLLLLPIGQLDGVIESPMLGSAEATPVRYERAEANNAPAELRFLDGIQLNGLVLDQLDLRIQPGEQTDVLLAMRGDVESSLALTVANRLDGFDLRLAPFELDYAEQTIRSEQDVTGRWLSGADSSTQQSTSGSNNQSSLQLNTFCLRWRDSQICGPGVTLGPTGELPLRISLRESYAGTLGDKPFTVSAHGDGTLALRWRDGAMEQGDFTLRMDDLAIDPLAEVGTAGPVHWESAQVHGRFDTDGGDVSLQVASPQIGSIDLQISEKYEVLSGSLDVNDLQLSSLVDLIPEWTLNAGRVDGALKLSGSRDNPLLHGGLQMIDGGLYVSALETAVDELNLLMTFAGKTVDVESTARIGGGAVSANGQCCAGGVFTGALEGSRNRVQLPQGLDAVFSPDMTLTLGGKQLDVSGLITIHDGVYTHTQPADGGIAISRDIVRIDAIEASPRRFLLNLDLRTLIEPGFTLRSREIESTLGGDLRLLLPADQPASLFGNLKVLGGELRVLGQALRLTDGDLGFVGDPLNPDLNISAEREIRTDNQRVGFRVRGTLDAPTFDLFSDPPRPDNEALSYLLRGRGPDVGASADGTAMALSLGASALNQSGWLSSLNSIPGLSGVALGAEGQDDDTAATISAYVGNRLYLSYGVGIYEPVNALTARLYLRSRLWLEVVSRLESSFDLYYRFDRN